VFKPALGPTQSQFGYRGLFLWD